MVDIIANKPKTNQVPYQERPEDKRNRKIMEHYNSGHYTVTSISRIFKISRTRVYEIIKRMKGGEKE